MSKPDMVRAWKDEEYRLSLSAAERAQLPENPAGLIDLSDADLDATAGGAFFFASTKKECTCSHHCATAFLARR